MKISLSHLSIEVTRRCNLNCPHCLRGDSVGIDLNLKKFDKFMSSVSWIDCVYFTGGEPLISIDTLHGIRGVFNRRKVEFGNFAVTTNGTMATPRVISMIKGFFDSAKYEGSYVHVSKDIHHEWDENREKNLEILSKELPDVSFDKIDKPPLLKIGRSELSGSIDPDRHEYAFEVINPSDNVDYPKCHHIMGDLFFSAKGDLHRDWEMSYSEMNKGLGLVYKIDKTFSPKNFIKFIRG